MTKFTDEQIEAIEGVFKEYSGIYFKYVDAVWQKAKAELTKPKIMSYRNEVIYFQDVDESQKCYELFDANNLDTYSSFNTFRGLTDKEAGRTKLVEAMEVIANEPISASPSISYRDLKAYAEEALAAHRERYSE